MLCSAIYSSAWPPLCLHLHSKHSSAAAHVDAEIRNTQSRLSSTQFSISTYNSLLRAETLAGNPNQTLLIFHRMLAGDELPPNRFTFPTLLKACTHLLALAEGKQIHSLFLKSHFAPSDDLFVLTSLLHFYARCGRLNDARLLFDQMPQRNAASCNAMLDGYLRSGDFDSAHKLFDEMPERNVISWNTMISGCVRNGWAWQALKLFLDIQILGMKADESTMASVVAAIADLGLLFLARMVHAYVTRSLFPFNGALGVALIDMYAKCGSIESSYNVFTTIESKNVSHWTSMIAGFASHGYADSALQVFDEMMNSGIIPNDITFIAVLNACSHGGLVYEGLECFKLMKSYKVEPGVKHYGCLVDLLGRAGFIAEAMEIVSEMPVEPSAVIWCSLLVACRNYGCVDVAEIAMGKLIELDSSKGSSFVLLSNLYGGLGRLEDFGSVRKVMAGMAVTKVVGISWIEIDGQVHEFVCGDRLHFRRGEIYGVLDLMRSCLMRQEEFE